MAKRLIGMSGPSTFTNYCVSMVEEFFNADIVMLYHNNESNLRRWVQKCDGVVLAGGVDIHPSVYDHSIWNNQGFSNFDLKRDERELQIIDWCNKDKKPYLGICRGHQLIGVLLGFFLMPDLSASTVCHSPSKQQVRLEDHEPLHAVNLVNPPVFAKEFKWNGADERSIINRVMAHDPKKTLYTNSYHHQGLAYLGANKVPEGVKVYGTARIDIHKIKSIVELMGGEHWLSCQWHPEADWRVNSASRIVLERFKTLINNRK